MHGIHRGSVRPAGARRFDRCGVALTGGLLCLALAGTRFAFAATPTAPQVAASEVEAPVAKTPRPSSAQAKQPAQKETQTAIDDYQAGNYPAALSEFKDAAEKGNRLAQFNYAMMQLNGEGTPVDLHEAEKWLRKAAEANMSHAQYAYGRLFDDGTLERVDPAEAHLWFLKAARQGHTQAQVALANQFMDGRGTKQDFAEAFVWYLEAAKSGDMASEYIVATYYERGGDGVTPNPEVARRWYAKAAAQGDPAALDRYRNLTEKLHPNEANCGKPTAK
ncbi:Secretory immunoglobulin A-binding protein EsiB [Pararobbsia alpina]|uniref:Secretory immunoglobulin A-binding protein EsiB n=1 Tax=Pararobbsia alpina TaxID=621374 RepID=A0A6S7AW59_9BURK|nr:Secretory immunoglobulin A-binding protein EsiB [Pararobbsia alpina]